MSPLYLKDGKILVQNGKLAISSSCCCNRCDVNDTVFCVSIDVDATTYCDTCPDYGEDNHAQWLNCLYNALASDDPPAAYQNCRDQYCSMQEHKVSGTLKFYFFYSAMDENGQLVLTPASNGGQVWGVIVTEKLGVPINTYNSFNNYCFIKDNTIGVELSQYFTSEYSMASFWFYDCYGSVVGTAGWYFGCENQEDQVYLNPYYNSCIQLGWNAACPNALPSNPRFGLMEYNYDFCTNPNPPGSGDEAMEATFNVTITSSSPDPNSVTIIGNPYGVFLGVPPVLDNPPCS